MLNGTYASHAKCLFAYFFNENLFFIKQVVNAKYYFIHISITINRVVRSIANHSILLLLLFIHAILTFFCFLFDRVFSSVIFFSHKNFSMAYPVIEILF